MNSSDQTNDKIIEYNCPNWDKSSWLSSHKYFSELLSHLVSHLSICQSSKVLDIGCARGCLLENLVNNYSFETRPIGIDPVDHLWDKKINAEFINSDSSTFLTMHKGQFDFIFIKQVLHLMPYNERQVLWVELKKKLAANGNIVVMQMSNDSNIPTFPLMREKLKKSINLHDEIYVDINKNFKILSHEKFDFQVSISRDEYINLVNDRFLSTLFYFTDEQIKSGSLWIEENYPPQLNFEDPLDISILRK